MPDSYLRITPLGGMGEIGLNCQLWQTSEGVVMIDCGLMFPSDELLGIDVLIPNFELMSGIREQLKGIVLTHGHEDHIGALPWIVPYLGGVTIYGSRFTLALVEQKLAEHGVLDFVSLVECNEKSVITLAGLRFHFFPVCHSIPEGFALGVESSVGRIIHSGDFKIERDPLTGEEKKSALLADFASQGVRLLLSDSTNVAREGHSLSEHEVAESLGRVFQRAEGRIIITLFSSHIRRIQAVFDLARKYKRTVVISGKSLSNNIEIAKSLKLLALPPHFYNAFFEVPDLPDKELVFLVTGAQGEPLSALSRMANCMHKQLSIRQGDIVVMSSRIIPGNTRAIMRMINAMYRQGAEVLYEDAYAIHASGHAHKEELKTLFMTVKPCLFVPMHGEYQHLVKHTRLARECGVKEENAIVLEDGVPLVLTPESFFLEERLTVESTYVDGKGIGDVGACVLGERRRLGDEGLVVCVLLLDGETKEILFGPMLLSKGFVYEQMYSYVLEDAKCVVLDEIEAGGALQTAQLEENIRLALRRFFRSILGRDPVIVPIVSCVTR